MGRYYKGDIEGKLMFGVRASNDADFFGVSGKPDNYIYHFTEKDLDAVTRGVGGVSQSAR